MISCCDTPGGYPLAEKAWSKKRTEYGKYRGIEHENIKTKKGPEGPFLVADNPEVISLKLERETRLELATPTLARSCSTN